jgi:23S rRNA (adenine2503-C2)-methyltransferase
MARGPHLSELAAEWQALGAKPQHVRRIFLAWAGLAPWEARKGESFPKAVAEALPGIRERLDRLSHALPVRSAEAETVKLILGLEDGECVESVLLPRQGLCVSTQVGCAVGCVFCMTGKGGLVRQLSSAEIVAQYCEARRVRSDVRKIVLMGMGEPSHNLDAVCEAVEFFGNVCGLAHKDIVVSTVGDHRLFDRLPALSVRPALALSLHTTDNALRRKLLTNSKDIPVETLLERTLDYADETGYPAQIEWTLMAGINDAPEQVERLADLIEGRYAMVNFIAVNPVEGSGFRRPESAHMQDLITILRRRGTVATLRDSAAQDIEGGCGQLRARVIGISRPDGPLLRFQRPPVGGLFFSGN